MPRNQNNGKKNFPAQNRGPFAPKPAPGKRADRHQSPASGKPADIRKPDPRKINHAFTDAPDVPGRRTDRFGNPNQRNEKPPFSNQKEGFRPDRRAPQGRPAGRFGRPAPSPDRNEWKNSPASQRFGPDSRPATGTGPKREDRRFTSPPRVVPSRPFENQKQQFTPPNPPEPVMAMEPDIAAENILSGRNPIREALKTGRDLEKLMVAKGELSGSARQIVSMAKAAGVMIQPVERSRLDQIIKNHQGMIAFASAYQYSSVEEILAEAKQKGEEPFVVVLDQVTDPHNLGAIIRTASCAGAHGVIVPLHRAVGLTPAAVKASAGAVEHVKVARVTNLNQTIKDLKQQGIWFYAADPAGEDYRSVPLSGACALVIGSEGEGVSQLTASLCDKRLRIPMRGELDSLNASVAAGILLYAVHNERHQPALPEKS